jgi:3-isopropylmalate/(R)-2-methylmalate dehydratase large subunit
MGQTLYQKVFDAHTVTRLHTGQYQLFMGLHLLNDITSPQGFGLLREKKLPVLLPERTFGVCDHMNPTDSLARPFPVQIAEIMIAELERNCRDHGVRYFSPENGEQGICHVIGPELGLTLPGMTICCGDSHTSTHGAFGSVAFGIGASQICDVLATQTMAMSKLKVRRIEFRGKLRPGVTAKDVGLYMIARLGVKGGVGYAYEYGGDLVSSFSMDERMTLCNLSIEAGARCGYVNPDEVTYSYLKGRRFAPAESDWKAACAQWESMKSDPDASYDDVVTFEAEDIAPIVTWGITPGQSVPIGDKLPKAGDLSPGERNSFLEALRHMGFAEGSEIKGRRIDVAFIGSCTNGRFSDFEAVAKLLSSGGYRVAPHVRALVVPGSQAVAQRLDQAGYTDVFRQAGFDVRSGSGCSLCIGMNPDHLVDSQLCASSSNRNFKGRQGSPTGRTVLMSPIMVAASAVSGAIADAREVFGIAQ